jgi:hypothetical protein
MKVRSLAALAACAAIAGCAKAPESIAPAYVSTVPYSSWTCKQLGEETQRIDAAYTTAATQQKQARGNDIAGVILIGLPVSSLSGDNIAPQIAQLKGEQDAVRKTMISKNCR